MTDQEIYLIGLRAIGKGGLVTQPGKITAWGFNIDEIAEIIEEDNRMEKNLENWNKERNLLSVKERENSFLSERCITLERAIETRSNYLLNKHNEAYRELKRAKYSQSVIQIKKADGKYNKAKFEYNIFSYRPEYNDSMISDEELESARNRYVREFIELDRRGFCKCPFHNERTASFHAGKNLFYCFGCEEKGDTIKFIIKLKNFTFKEAVKFINQI